MELVIKVALGVFIGSVAHTGLMMYLTFAGIQSLGASMQREFTKERSVANSTMQPKRPVKDIEGAIDAILDEYDTKNAN